MIIALLFTFYIIGFIIFIVGLAIMPNKSITSSSPDIDPVVEQKDMIIHSNGFLLMLIGLGINVLTIIINYIINLTNCINRNRRVTFAQSDTIV